MDILIRCARIYVTFLSCALYSPVEYGYTVEYGPLSFSQYYIFCFSPVLCIGQRSMATQWNMDLSVFHSIIYFVSVLCSVLARGVWLHSGIWTSQFFTVLYILFQSCALYWPEEYGYTVEYGPLSFSQYYIFCFSPVLCIGLRSTATQWNMALSVLNYCSHRRLIPT